MATNQDPHGFIAEGKRRSMAYLYRQLWNMRYVTLIVAGAMSTYTITQGTWIPFIDAHLFNFMFFFLVWWFGMTTLPKLAALAIQYEKTNNEDLPTAYRAMGHVAWMMWFLSAVGTYWAVVLGWAYLFAGP